MFQRARQPAGYHEQMGWMSRAELGKLYRPLQGTGTF